MLKRNETTKQTKQTSASLWRGMGGFEDFFASCSKSTKRLPHKSRCDLIWVSRSAHQATLSTGMYF